MSTSRLKKPLSRNLARRFDHVMANRMKGGRIGLGPGHREQLRTLRKALGLTLEHAAARVGCSPSVLSRFERAEATGKLRLETVAKIFRAYECRFVYLPLPEYDADFLTLCERIATRGKPRSYPFYNPDWWRKNNEEGLSSEQASDQGAISEEVEKAHIRESEILGCKNFAT